MNSAYETVSRKTLGKDKWDTIVNASDNAWLWHLYDFQDILCTWASRADKSFAVLDYS